MLRAIKNIIIVFSKLFSTQDFTLDKCSVQIAGLIEQVKTDDVNICQMYCNLIYAGRCKFFVFDKKVNLCSLLDEPVENYESTCLKFAGPKQPKYSDCATDVDSDPCKVSKTNQSKAGMPFAADAA